MQDVHTETYLDTIKSLIIEMDDTKNKIIDLNQCNTKTAFELLGDKKLPFKMLH